MANWKSRNFCMNMPYHEGLIEIRIIVVVTINYTLPFKFINSIHLTRIDNMMYKDTQG